MLDGYEPESEIFRPPGRTEGMGEEIMARTDSAIPDVAIAAHINILGPPDIREISCHIGHKPMAVALQAEGTIASRTARRVVGCQIAPVSNSN